MITAPAISQFLCKNCDQPIAQWVIPKAGRFKENAEWRHVCENPEGLHHFRLHLQNEPNGKRRECYSPEPVDFEIDTESKDDNNS